jgi:lysophospholipase L1-like esterase
MRVSGYAADGVMPNVSGKIEFSANKYGLRGPEVDMDRVDFRILVVGGSTAECRYITDKLSWPWKLGDKLSPRLGKKVFVGNAAKSGDFTLNHIEVLKNYPWVDKFDLVIVLCGVNDMGTLLRNNYHRRAKGIILKYKKMIYYRELRLYYLLQSFLYPALSEGAIVQGSSGSYYVGLRQIRKMALDNRTIRDEPKNLQEALDIYKDNLREIIYLCKKRNQRILMLTQPSMWRDNLPQGLGNLLWEHVDQKSAYSAEVLEQVLRAYNIAMLDVCKEEGVSCIDLDTLLVKDTSVFYDDVHFNIPGCNRVSEILSDEICELLKSQ